MAMTIMTASGLPGEAEARIERRQLDLPAEIRIGAAAHSARVTTLHAAGVELDLPNAAEPGEVFADEVVVAIPSLGQYKARRLRQTGTRAAYLFEVTEFSRRALGALIADRFPD
jgi:hypothetical protein